MVESDRTRCRAAAAIALVAAAVVCLPARARGANVELWACHGPRGEGLGSVPLEYTAHGEGRAATYGQGCNGPAGSGGLSATFSVADPEGGSQALWQLDVPSGVTLHSLRMARETSGFGGEQVSKDPQVYEAATSTAVVESAALDEPLSDLRLGGELVAPSVTGRYVRVRVSCGLGAGEPCAVPPDGETVGVKVSSIALGVLDESPPSGAVGGVLSPLEAGEAEELSLDASDAGLGLASAEALIDGHEAAFVRLGSGACPERPAASARINLPLGADGCPSNVSNVALGVPVEGVGPHTLQVRVTDAAGETTTLLDRTIEVQSPPQPGPDTLTLGIGSEPGRSSAGGGGSPGGSSAGGRPGRGEVRGAREAKGACRAPRLSVRLASRPLRYARRHVPVLRARHRYLFRGRLTCLRGGRRVAAPAGSAVEVLYRVHRRSFFKWLLGTAKVRRGRLRVRLGFPRPGALLFRYRARDGEAMRVRLRIALARGHARLTHRHRHGGRPRR